MIGVSKGYPLWSLFFFLSKKKKKKIPYSKEGIEAHGSNSATRFNVEFHHIPPRMAVLIRFKSFAISKTLRLKIYREVYF